MSNPHTLYAVETGAGLIDEIMAFRLNKNQRMSVLGADGDIEPRLISLDQQDPMIEFETAAIARALGIVGVNGLSVPGDPDFATFFFQRMELEGARSTGTTHLLGTVGAGLFIPLRLRAEQGKPARLTLALHPRYLPPDNPIVWTAAQELVGTPAFDQVYTLGKVMINGAQLPNVEAVDIDFGLELYKPVFNGDIWTQFISILQRDKARIRIRTKEPVAENTYGLTGVAQAATDSIIYLRKKSPDGAGNVANATAQHISISVAAGHIGVEDSSADHPQPFDSNVVITPRWDGTNPVLNVATAVAIV